MSGSIRTRLTEPGRTWTGHPGAIENAVQALVKAAPVSLPDLLCDLLRAFDGGEGELALEPRWFVLDSAAEIRRNLTDADTFPGLIFFGGNGGLERIALDTRRDTSQWPVVAVDPVAGMSSLMMIASDLDTFVDAIGREYEE